METRTFGSTQVSVPVVGQGTWQIQDNQAVEQTLRRGLELGMMHIDTAELYTGAEAVVAAARAAAGRVPAMSAEDARVVVAQAEQLEVSKQSSRPPPRLASAARRFPALR